MVCRYHLTVVKVTKPNFVFETVLSWVVVQIWKHLKSVEFVAYVISVIILEFTDANNVLVKFLNIFSARFALILY
jgi:hypothetical protein